MTIVAEQPAMTQQTSPLETGYENVYFVDLTKRSEYQNVDLALREYELRFQKRTSPIEARITEAMFLGSRGLTGQENTLSSAEVNSMSTLMGSYKRELVRANKIAPHLIAQARHTYGYVSKKLYKLPFQNCAVEINSDGTMKYSLLFSNDRVLMLTIEMNSDVARLRNKPTMYSFFINRKLIASDVTNLETFTKNFKEYITL